MIKKVAFTTYPVTDMARARAFYEDFLSLKPGSTSKDGTWTEYDIPGGGCFSITTYMKGSHAEGACVAFEVDNIDEMVADLKSKGVKFHMDVMQTPVCKMAGATDSEGNGFMLHQLNPKKA